MTTAAQHLPDFVEALDGGIFAIDTGLQRTHFAAAYLMVDGGQAAFIDTGTSHALPRLLAALEAAGLMPDAVQWVIPTHIHLDHAGGAGALMQALPQARLLVHPRGVRHMIDPSALYQGALGVYGAEEMERHYGRLLPVPAERVIASSDGMRIELGQRTLELIDTPGHARHHHCIWDPLTQGWFSGDTFGIAYRELAINGRAWIFPTSSPVQFEPGALRLSITRMLARQPQKVYLTHFGAQDHIAALAQSNLALLDDMIALGENLRHSPRRHADLCAALLALYQRSLRVFGSPLSDAEIARLLALDIDLNAQGIGIWLDRSLSARPEGPGR